MDNTEKKSLQELNDELINFFEGVKKRMAEVKSKGYVSVGIPADGSVACIRLSNALDIDLVCDSVRVFATTSHNGSFGVAIPCDEIPLSEQRWLMNQYFKTCKEAYSFVLDRAIEINDFFTHR